MMLYVPEYIREDLDDGKKYTLKEKIVYVCPKTGRTVTCFPGDRSDGATGALDVPSCSWWFHDQVCNTGMWDNGEICTNLEASLILSRALRKEHSWKTKKYWTEWRLIRSGYWFISTFAVGGGKCRGKML